MGVTHGEVCEPLRSIRLAYYAYYAYSLCLDLLERGYANMREGWLAGCTDVQLAGTILQSPYFNISSHPARIPSFPAPQVKVALRH